MSQLMQVIAETSIKAFNQGYAHGLSQKDPEDAKPGSFVNIAFDTGFIAGIKFALDAAEFVSHPDDNDHDMLSLQDLKEELEDRKKATRRTTLQQTDDNNQKMKQTKEGN